MHYHPFEFHLLIKTRALGMARVNFQTKGGEGMGWLHFIFLFYNGPWLSRAIHLLSENCLLSQDLECT